LITFNENTELRILLLDNYDSFTWNLYHYLEPYATVSVVRNDAISVEEAATYDKVVLSPGPGLPNVAGVMPQIIAQLSGKVPILGICLGMQGIAEHFGGTLYNLTEVKHGIATNCTVLDSSCSLFNNVPASFEVGHYHSWAVRQEQLPSCLTVTATNDDGIVMGLRHNDFDVQGLQFHPESILTQHGKLMLRNWVEDK